MQTNPRIRALLPQAYQAAKQGPETLQTLATEHHIPYDALSIAVHRYRDAQNARALKNPTTPKPDPRTSAMKKLAEAKA